VSSDSIVEADTSVPTKSLTVPSRDLVVPSAVTVGVGVGVAAAGAAVLFSRRGRSVELIRDHDDTNGEIL
jgi:hypothetical protein